MRVPAVVGSVAGAVRARLRRRRARIPVAVECRGARRDLRDGCRAPGRRGRRGQRRLARTRPRAGRAPGPGRALGASPRRPGRGADRGRPRCERRLRRLRAPSAAATSWSRSTRDGDDGAASGPAPGWSPRSRDGERAADLARHRDRPGRRCAARRGAARRRATCATATRWRSRVRAAIGLRRRLAGAADEVAARLHAAAGAAQATPAPLAAIVYLGSLRRRRLPLLEPDRARRRRRRRSSSPGRPPGARRALRVARALGPRRWRC